MESRGDWQRDRYGPVERSEMESDKEKRRNVVCATTADASQVMIVLSSKRRYTQTHSHRHFLRGIDMKMFYFGGQTSAVHVYHSNSVSLSLSLFLLAVSSLASISFSMPLCVH